MEIFPYIVNKNEYHFVNENNIFVGHYMLIGKHVVNVYVDPQFRGVGICKKMMKYLLYSKKNGEIGKRKNKGFYLEVLKDNKYALKCYLSSGFSIKSEGWKYIHLES